MSTIIDRSPWKPVHFASGLCSVLLLLPIVGCEGEPPAKEPLRPVRTTEVVASAGVRTRSFSGTVRAGQETELSFRVPGSVERLNVKIGDRVRAGQLIAQLEPNDFEIAVRQAEADLQQAEAAARNNEADLERIRGLWENGNASQNDLDATLAQAQSAAAKVDSIRQSLERSRRQLDYTRLRAPVDGAIAAVPVEVNENVLQGQTVVMVTSGKRLEVEVAMPGVLISQIRESAPVSISFDALPDESFDGVVTEVGVASTGTATTFPVTCALTSDIDAIRSGMSAEVSFQFESTSDRTAIYLPPQAVGEDRDGRFVYLLEPTEEVAVGRVRRTPVTIGQLTRDGLQILDGLSTGQQVVTAGVRRLHDGQSVKLPERGIDG